MPTEEQLQNQAASSDIPASAPQDAALQTASSVDAAPQGANAAAPSPAVEADSAEQQEAAHPSAPQGQPAQTAAPSGDAPAESQEEAPASAPEQAADAPSAQSAPADDEKPFELVPTSEFKQIVETLLFITDRPLKPTRIADVIDGADARRVREMILEIQDDYIRRNSAVQVVEVGGGFQMSTKPEYGRWVRRLYNEKMTTKLSNAALETLAIVAYKQPITRAEMEAIRGVDVAGPLERLLERSLVRVVGKKDTVGRPMVYGTTDEFLRMFGLNKVSDLPDLQVFAAKSLHAKQADLPFDEPLPPLPEPAIIPLDELEGKERLEALDSSADPFFTRNSYNKGDFFGLPAEQTPSEAQPDAFAADETAQNAAPEASADTQPNPAAPSPEAPQAPAAAQPLQPQNQDVPQEEN